MRRCPDCGFTEFSRAEVRRHRRDVHGFVVLTCKRKFLKTEYMEQHRRMSGKHNSGLAMFGSGITRLSAAFDGLSVSSESDLYALRKENLERFYADNIQADTIFLLCCGDVINKLVRDLQDTEKAPKELRPRRVIKSGSLGKGTAVKGRSDIDLVLMLVGYDRVGVLMTDMGSILVSLERYLKSHTAARHQKTTRYSVQVELTCRSGHSHDVDILPAVDLLGQAFIPGMSAKEIYRQMKTVPPDVIHEYSVTLAPLQLEIMTGLPTKVKNLIKLVKFWKDKKLKEQGESEMPSFADRRYGKPNWPSSYALELIIINSWVEANEPVSFVMTRALHAVLTSLVDHANFKIVLRRQMKYSCDMIQSRGTPYIMDPANPYNDMYHGLVDGQAFDWNYVVPEARRWLGRPLFYGVSGTKHTWK